MKARLLKKILNNTKYIVHEKEKHICVGSPLCHDLISVSKDMLHIRYALDTFNEGRESIKTEELRFIYDKLHELVGTGEIKDIIEGKDEIENPLPVFLVSDKGEIVESVTDAYGWPNVDQYGKLLYEGEHFKTREEAVNAAIKDFEHKIKVNLENIQYIEEQLYKTKSLMAKNELKLTELLKQKNQ